MSRRIVIEEPCEHDWLHQHLIEQATDPNYLKECPGGSRTVLEGIPDEWVEAAVARWELMSDMDTGGADWSIEEWMTAALDAAVFGETP